MHGRATERLVDVKPVEVLGVDLRASTCRVVGVAAVVVVEEESAEGVGNVRGEVERPRIVRLVETRVPGEGGAGGVETCVCVRRCVCIRVSVCVCVSEWVRMKQVQVFRCELVLFIWGY